MQADGGVGNAQHGEHGAGDASVIESDLPGAHGPVEAGFEGREAVEHGDHEGAAIADKKLALGALGFASGGEGDLSLSAALVGLAAGKRGMEPAEAVGGALERRLGARGAVFRDVSAELHAATPKTFFLPLSSAFSTT